MNFLRQGFESYRLTDRQIDMHYRNYMYIPHRFAGGQQQQQYTLVVRLSYTVRKRACFTVINYVLIRSYL